ncbi:MAG: MFS transporter [Actinobacteria bacterium]|nr:MFS transporter [Actinomycetota bacterium]
MPGEKRRLSSRRQAEAHPLRKVLAVDDNPLEPHPLIPERPRWSHRLRGLTMDLTPLRTSREYRLLWLGSGISYIGTQLTFVAIPYQVYRITGSTLAVGLTALFELVPLLLLSLVGGAVADAVDRRKLLLVTDSLLALNSLILALHATGDNPKVWILYALAAVNAGLYAMGSPGLRSATPHLLPPEQLVAAAALTGSVQNLGAVAGPMIAGTLIAVIGLPWTYGLDLLTYLVSIVFIFLIAPIPPLPDSNRVSARSVLDGIRFLKGRHVLQGSFVVDINAMVFGMPTALFPAFALERYGGGPEIVGFLYAAPSAGALLAALLSGWTGKIRRQGLAVYIAVLSWGGSLVAFGLSATLLLGLVFLAIAGAADEISAIFRNAILQTAAPKHMQGRLSGLELAVVASGPSLGDLEAGVVASATSIGFAVVSGGFLCIAGVGVIALLMPQFARYDARNPTP